jgi:hypothetical protein
MERNAQEEPQELGLAGRMLRVFFAPSETFEAVGRRASWLDWFAPVLVVALLGTAAVQATLPLILQAQAAAVQEQLKNLPAEQRQQAAAQVAAVGRISTLVMVPIMGFAVLFAAGGILLLVANQILDGQAEYRQMLAVWAYSSLVGVVALLVRFPLMLAKQTAVVHTGLGILLSEEMLKTFLGRVVAGVDLFTLWQACLVAVGLGVLAGTSTRRAMVPVLLLWVILVLVQAGLGGLGGMGKAG